MDPVPRPQPRPTVASVSPVEPIAERTNRAVANEIDPQLDGQIGPQIRAQIGSQIATAMAAQNVAAADPKTVEALIAALADSDPDVREMVGVTLGRRGGE